MKIQSRTYVSCAIYICVMRNNKRNNSGSTKSIRDLCTLDLYFVQASIAPINPVNICRSCQISDLVNGGKTN